MEELQELSDFFARANSSAFEKKLLFAVDAIRNADLTILWVWDHPAHSQNMENNILQIWDILQ